MSEQNLLMMTPSTPPDAPSTERGRYICESCASFYHQPGMCPSCPDEPLVDVRDEQAMRLILEREERRHFARAAKFAILGIFVMTPLHLLLFAVMSPLYLKLLIYMHKAGVYLLLFISLVHLSGFGVSVLWVEHQLMRRFPTKRVSTLIYGESKLNDQDFGFVDKMRDFLEL
jgi:hypothetical protein